MPFVDLKPLGSTLAFPKSSSGCTKKIPPSSFGIAKPTPRGRQGVKKPGRPVTPCLFYRTRRGTRAEADTPPGLFVALLSNLGGRLSLRRHRMGHDTQRLNYQAGNVVRAAARDRSPLGERSTADLRAQRLGAPAVVDDVKFCRLDARSLSSREVVRAGRDRFHPTRQVVKVKV